MPADPSLFMADVPLVIAIAIWLRRQMRITITLGPPVDD